MLRLIGRKLLVAIPTLFIVAALTFLLVQLVPGDPANFILGRNATSDQIAQLHQQLGLDRPLLVQFGSWFGGVVHGDFGVSLTSGDTVLSSLELAIGPTLSLAVLATLLSTVVGVLVGNWIAVRGGRLDRMVQAISGLGLAIPSFWVAALLVYLFALKLTIFPATGYTAITDSPSQWILGLVLPAVAVALNNLCQVVLQSRSSVLDVLSKDFVRTLQAAGMPRRRLLFKHVLRNASIPIATVTGLSFIYMLSGVVVIEAIFNTPGMGNLLLTSVESHDLPMVQGAVLLFGVMVILVNIAIDLVTAWLDPRIRLS